MSTFTDDVRELVVTCETIARILLFDHEAVAEELVTKAAAVRAHFTLGDIGTGAPSSVAIGRKPDGVTWDAIREFGGRTFTRAELVTKLAGAVHLTNLSPMLKRYVESGRLVRRGRGEYREAEVGSSAEPAPDGFGAHARPLAQAS